MLRILRNPLLYFLPPGGLMFLLYFFIKPPGNSEISNTILATRSTIDQFKQVFQRQWQRPWAHDELQGLIRARMKEEILLERGAKAIAFMYRYYAVKWLCVHGIRRIA